MLLAWKAPRPDILISADAGMVGVRDASGTLRVLSSRRDDFVLKEWLAADGDARAPKDPTLTDGTRCDSNGCVARLADGRAVALSLTAEGLSEDCEAAALVVTARKAPPGCAATVIDRERARTDGALAAIRDGRTLALQAARPPASQRPWMTGRPVPISAGPSIRNPAPAPVDSTPRPQDLDPDELGSEPRFD
jgi:competence protein ComEC